MDVYVASKAENYPVVRLFMRALEDAGHDITHDWTHQVEHFGASPPSIDMRRQSAMDDEKGVRACDVFILVMHKGMVGSLIEFGMALALNKEIYIVGDVMNLPVDSIFFDSTEFTWHNPLGDQRRQVRRRLAGEVR
jgi:hypothetical protein